MIFSLKSLKVPKWGNLDLSYVAGKLTMSDSKKTKLLNLNQSFHAKFFPLGNLNRKCDGFYVFYVFCTFLHFL